ncbi:MAG: hypothetical protein LBV19_10550 [Streptococcaceae bacterium]|jgi:ABC-2 type transport system permease protein|nr:hypothetical protein [Streptococcaceae bacterium]
MKNAINIIQADFFRLIRSRAVWLTEALMLLLVIWLNSIQEVGTMVGGGDAKNTITSWDGIHSIFNQSISAEYLIYFLTVIFILTTGVDLSKSLLKNIVSSGIPRESYFFSKYLVFNLISLLHFVVYYAIVFITASLFNGVGIITPDLLGRFFGTAALQYLFLQAIFAIGFFVLYLTFSAVWSVLSIILFPAIINMIHLITKADWISYLDYHDALMIAQQLSQGKMMGLIFSAIAAIILLIGGTSMYFQRKGL